MYDGDPKIYSTGSGSILEISGGQPVMDEGLENSVYISLFTAPGFWGNSISKDPEKMGSLFETIMTRTLTNQARLDAEEYAKAALLWMISEGVAKKINVSAVIPEINILYLLIEIEQPDKTTNIKYQINWANMAIRAGV